MNGTTTQRALTLLSLIFLCTGFVKAQWATPFPGSARNAHTFTVSPKASRLIYSFGNDMLIFDTESNTWRINEDYTRAFQFIDAGGSVLNPSVGSDVFFISNEKGFVVNRNKVFRTINGGADWQSVLELTSHAFTNLYFVNEQVGFVVGAYGELHKTVDGGNTWQRKSGPWSQASAPFVVFTEVVFSDEMNGMAVAYQADNPQANFGAFKAIIEKTSDGGETWNEIQVLPGVGESDHHYAHLKLLPGNTAYLSLSNRNYFVPDDMLLRSTDGGQTWTSISLPGAFPGLSLVIRDMHWFDADHGLVIGSDTGDGQEDNVFVTDDGGTTWQTIVLNVWPYPNFDQNYTFSMAFQGDEGIITGAHGSLVHTEDRGKTWNTLVFPYPDLKDICMLDEAHGFAAGNNGLLLKKEGDEWNTITAPTKLNLNRIVFADTQNGAVKGFGVTYVTENGGSKWTTLTYGFDTTVLDMTFAHGDLYLLTKLGTSKKLVLFKTRGTSKVFEPIIVDSDITSRNYSYGCLQITGSNRFIVLYGGKLYSSENAGLNWSTTNTPAAASNDSRFLFINDDEGFLTAGTTLWKTINRGTAWTQGILNGSLNNFFIGGFARMECNNQTKIIGRGWDVPSGEPTKDFMVESSDLGNTWSVIEMPRHPQTSFIGISGWSVLNNTLYLAGTGGTIMTYTCEAAVDPNPDLPTDPTPNPGEEPVTGIEEIPLHKIRSFEVYPVPVQNKLTIQATDKAADVKWSMHDSLGRTIDTGYSPMKDSNAFQINVSALPPGVYFLHLKNAVLTEVYTFLKK